MSDSTDHTIVQWALGGATTILAGVLKVIWNRQTEADARHAAEMRDVWGAITKDRDDAQKGRERMLERLGDMPTKSDLANLETRIAAMLAPRAGSD